MQHVFLIGTLPSSVYNFRGELVRAIVNNINCKVSALASKANTEDIKAVDQLGAEYIDYPVSRSGLNPKEDFKTFKALRSIFKEQQPNVILAYTIKPIIWGAFAARYVPNCRFYALVTGLGFAFQKGCDVTVFSKSIFESSSFNISEKMMIQDTLSYMQHDILTKVDRASMANSLETRVPFLDNDVFKTAWSIPFEHKIYNGQTKYPLRKIISKYVPDNLMSRPKAGFGVPISDWLRGDLRDWAENLLSKESLSLSGNISHQAVQKIWHEHQSGKANH